MQNNRTWQSYITLREPPPSLIEQWHAALSGAVGALSQTVVERDVVAARWVGGLADRRNAQSGAFDQLYFDSPRPRCNDVTCIIRVHAMGA